MAVTDTVNPPAPPQLAPRYRLWRRASKGRWLAIAGGDTEAESWAKLCKIMDRSPGHHDSLILPYPQEP